MTYNRSYLQQAILGQANRAVAEIMQAYPDADCQAAMDTYLRKRAELEGKQKMPAHDPGCCCEVCDCARAELLHRSAAAVPEKRCTRADRERVADLLSLHYAAGSLDDDEFGERLDKAMTAKFPSVLSGLCTDLPYLPSEPPAEQRPARHPELWTIQSALSFYITFIAVLIGGTHPGLLFELMMLTCCMVNALLGLRVSWWLAVTGFLTGPFAFLGTLLMLGLTRRRKASPIIK